MPSARRYLRRSGVIIDIDLQCLMGIIVITIMFVCELNTMNFSSTRKSVRLIISVRRSAHAETKIKLYEHPLILTRYIC